MNMLIDLVKMFFNGQKFNTGIIVVVLTEVFVKLGLSHDMAVDDISKVMYGIGGAWALIGFVHKWIKQYREQNAKK